MWILWQRRKKRKKQTETKIEKKPKCIIIKNGSEIVGKSHGIQPCVYRKFLFRFCKCKCKEKNENFGFRKIIENSNWARNRHFKGKNHI